MTREIEVSELLEIVGSHASESGRGKVTRGKLANEVAHRLGLSREVASVVLDGIARSGWITFYGPRWHLSVPEGRSS